MTARCRLTGLLFVLVSYLCNAQNGEIKGRILSSDQKNLEGVSVQLKNTNYGCITTADGKYLLKAPSGTYTLLVSALGNYSNHGTVEVEEGKTIEIKDIQLSESAISLNDVVVTGQFEKQSLRNSVYQVRTIDSERIRLRGATNIQSILNTELGIRFTTDPMLGTSDIQLMGLKGQNVKILLDGVPMVDRGETRESLAQIDINTIERIEIVEGPMSVIYGTDALAGVINIITKKGDGRDNLSIGARIQEETISKEYQPLNKKGSHLVNLGANWQKKGFQLTGNITRNNFGGWQGSNTGRAKTWLPKDQMLYTAGLGYAGKNWNTWYRFNGTDETINYLGNANGENVAGDKDYITKRLFHQLQGEIKLNEKLDVSGALSFTDYSRRTLSTNIDLNTGRRTLSTDLAAQDKSTFTSTFFRGIAKYKISEKVSLLPGIEINNNNATGQRINGSPTINEFAFFVSSDLKLTPWFRISPGVRFLKNSIYDAPPVIPSLNAKINLSKSLDLRMAYARGFRSPALRELYFNFHDASHSINGNTNLKAENSDSFNAFLVWNAPEQSRIRLTSTLGTFYNVFHDRIDTALDPNNPTQTTYLNIDRFKTTGFSLENKLHWNRLQATIGANYIGTYNEIFNDTDQLTDLPDFVWSPEVNANLMYSFSNIGLIANLSYKFTGVKPVYVLSATNPVTATLNKTESYHIADISLTKSIGKSLSIIGGAKNLFNVTNLRSAATGGAHEANSASFSGRAYFLGLSYKWSKN